MYIHSILLMNILTRYTTALVLFFSCLSWFSNSLYAQIVGGHCYLMRNAVEMVVSACGTYGIDTLPPAGYHPNVPGRFGFVADPARNGWTVPGPSGLPNYVGDYFTPGSPEEGFSLEFNVGTTNYVYGNHQVCWSTAPSGGIPGSIIAYNTTPNSRQAVWQGTIMGLQITQTTTVFTDSLYILTCVNIQNTSTTNFTNVYYSRNIDPDNEQPWTGNYTTTNTIVYQQPASAGSRALVSAVGLTHNTYFGLGTKDSRARVTYGGFSNYDPSDIWNGGIGFFGSAIGSTNTADEGISLAFNIGNIPAGGCADVAYVYVLSQSQLESALGATAPKFLANSVDITDTGIALMGCNGPTSVNLEIIGGGSGSCNNLSSWNWTWSPATGLSTTTGTNVTATPTSTTTYTATATDNCGSVVFSQQIKVIVAPSLNISLPSTYYYCDSTVNIDLMVSGGTPFTSFPTCGVSSFPCSGPQNTYTVGTSTINNGIAGYPNPYGNWYWGARHQFIIRASELTAAGLTAGNIDRIAFEVISTNGVAHNNFTIRIGCTSDSVFTSVVPASGLTTVLGPISHTPVVGWNNHIFTTPFYWNGVSHLIVETCFNNSSYSQNSPVKCTDMGYNCTRVYYADVSNVCTTNMLHTLSTIRPNIQFRHCTTSPVLYYNYAWSPASGLSCTNCQDPVATPATTPTSYTVTVTDANGCTATATTTIMPCLPTSANLLLQGNAENNQYAVLTWNDISITPLKYFELKRSKDGIHYEKIATINSSNENKYQYMDNNLKSGTYFYILRRVNADGSENYSNTVKITVTSAEQGFTVNTIAPNPASDEVTIIHELSIAGKVQFSVYDLTGKKLKDLYEGTLNTGRYTQRFSVSDLANGNYLISAIFNGNAQHFRLNVIR